MDNPVWKFDPKERPRMDMGQEKSKAVAVIVAAKKYPLAEKRLLALTEAVKTSNTRFNKNLEYGFNEWLKAQNGRPMGQNWQTWSAALYLYAAKCVEERRTPFFDEIRLAPG